MLVDGAAILGNHRIHAGVKALDQAAQILGIELGRKCSESAEVGEEDRHLPAFAACLPE